MCITFQIFHYRSRNTSQFDLWGVFWYFLSFSIRNPIKQGFTIFWWVWIYLFRVSRIHPNAIKIVHVISIMKISTRGIVNDSCTTITSIPSCSSLPRLSSSTCSRSVYCAFPANEPGACGACALFGRPFPGSSIPPHLSSERLTSVFVEGVIDSLRSARSLCSITRGL